jgi:EmrB/QacA subfamily drug resistance transporter
VHAPDRQHYNITLAILTLAGTAYSLLQTMVVPALPTFQHELHTTEAWATWVLTVFLLVASVATPILGKLGDQYGKERVLVISLAIFLAGLIGAAAAWNIWSLIAFRAVQGAAGAVFPLSFGIIRDEFPRERLGVAIGLISAVFGIGGGLGIVLAGVIVDNLSWRWLFIVGAIAVAGALVLVARFVPESPIKTPSRVDVPGAVLLSVSLICLLLALTEGEAWGWSSARILGLFAAFVVTIVVWVRVELRVAEPLVDMRMMVRRPVLFTNATALVAGFAMFGTFVLVPTFAETSRHVADYGFGATATRAGLYLLPSSAVLLFAGPVAGLLGKRVGYKWPLAIGMVVVGFSSGWLCFFHDTVWELVFAMPFLGLGIGFAFSAMATLITEAVDMSETGVATGINTVMRTIGGVVGAQIGAALLTTYVLRGTHVPTVKGFEIAFAVGAATSFVAAVLALLVTPWRGRAVLATARVS